MRNRTGITFIEALIGVFITSIMLGAIVGFYVHAHKAETHGAQALDSLQDAQQLLTYLLDDLQALAPPPEQAPAEWVAFRDVDDDGKPELVFHRFTGIDESSGRATRQTITYEVNPPTTDTAAGPREHYLLRTAGADTKYLARGGLRTFTVRPHFGCRQDDGGLRRYVDDRPAPPTVEGVARFWLELSFTVEQFNETGEPTTTLPVRCQVFPRALNSHLHDHWIEQSDDNLSASNDR